MGKALVLAVVAVSVGLLVYWLARPRDTTPTARRVSSSAPTDPNASPQPGSPQSRTDGVSPPAAPSDTGPIEPPRTQQEKERDAVEIRRRPLYSRLHQDLGAELVAVRPSDDDPATLDLYAARDAPGNTITQLNLAFRANIAYYGFRHIRFFVPNPPGSIEKYRLDAEANADSAGNWQIFKK